MLGLPLAFTVPIALVALAALPVLYYLLRVTPPRPMSVPFPPLKLILDLEAKDETPAHTPWWLLALRLAVAAAIILAMAGPIWNPLPAGEAGKGPLLVLIDDGWAAAPNWDRRIAAASERVAGAARDGRPAAVLAISDGEREILPSDGRKAIERLRALKPSPSTPDRLAVLPAVSRFLDQYREAGIVWICDDLEVGQEAELGKGRAFAERLAQLAGNRSVNVLEVKHTALAINAAENGVATLDIHLLRSDPGAGGTGRIAALDLKGLTIGEANFDFAGATKTQAHFDLPIELRNEVNRVVIADERSAGAVTLLDSRWKRRRIGIITGTTADVAQPLLSPTYYLIKALAPFADVREARGGGGDAITSLLDQNVAVMVLADIGALSGAAHDRLAQFVEEGGVLLRFAGVRLAAGTDDLVPVRLRRGGRVLGGSLSWETPKKLSPFDRDSPFFGLSVPDEVTVARQVLAEPEVGLAGKTWAALADGTPLVTAAHRKKGLIVLAHVTADTTWSNLPLSGLFVEMLRRIVNLSGTTSASKDTSSATAGNTDPEQQAQATALAPNLTLDGFGTLGPPPVTARPVVPTATLVASAEHPPGLYGPSDALVAVNTLQNDDHIAPLDFSGIAMNRQTIIAAQPIDLRPLLVLLAVLAFVADAIATVWLAGPMQKKTLPPQVTSAMIIVALMLGALPPAATPGRAQTASSQDNQPLSPRDLEAVSKTRLAYVVTGDARVDEASRLGLTALSHALAERTTLAPGDPMGIDPARDELAFYPLIYWPVVADRPQPTAAAVTHIDNFMKQGGSVIFDTRDALTNRHGGPPTPEELWLRQLLAGVDVPELEPVPKNHVATLTFYLIDGFVGRYATGETWIEALPPETGDEASRPARAGDSVSPIIITANDLAGAWAADRYGEPLYPLIPGAPRQREMAVRGGINLVMYALTGNYKADQVHVPYLLERLAH
jgi:hypothetical protein